MNKRAILFLLTICIFSLFANAFEINITPVKDDIYEDESGLYLLSVTNDKDFTDYYTRPATYQVDWITYTEPGVISVPPRSTKTFNLTIDPKSTVMPGQHEVLLSIGSTETNEYVDSSLFIYVRSLNQVFPGYKASLALSVDVPYEIDPRNEVPVTIYLRNRNVLEIKNMTLIISSKLINKEINIPFTPLEEKTQSLVFTLDKYQLPLDDTLEVKVIVRNVTINTKSIPIKIVPYTTLIEDITVKKSFLKSLKIINLTNDGNTLNEEDYLVPITFFQNVFTTTQPQMNVVNKEKKYLVYKSNLNPLESQVISIETNYRIIVYVILIIGLSIFTYFRYRSPILIKKRVIPIHGESGGVSEFHIRLLIMNRTKQPVENVGVREIIPKIVQMIKEDNVGTLQPSKVIKHDKKGTLVKWDINYLEPYEERIITFKILSKLGIVGGFLLPKTKVKYETSTGRQRVTYSSKEAVKI